MPFWLFALVVVLGGCAAETPKDLPGNAQLVVQGNDKITYTAPSHGTVYVYDNNNDHLLYSGEVHKGDALTVDPQNDWIKLGDRKVSEHSLATGRDHRIFFVPDATHRTSSESTSVDTDRDNGRVRASGSVDTDR
jgi:hypothetical protein